MESLIKTKGNVQYTDTARATYQDLAIMGVRINNIEQVVSNVLTYFINLIIQCFPKASFARLMYTYLEDLTNFR